MKSIFFRNLSSIDTQQSQTHVSRLHNPNARDVEVHRVCGHSRRESLLDRTSTIHLFERDWSVDPIQMTGYLDGWEWFNFNWNFSLNWYDEYDVSIAICICTMYDTIRLLKCVSIRSMAGEIMPVSLMVSNFLSFFFCMSEYIVKRAKRAKR